MNCSYAPSVATYSSSPHERGSPTIQLDEPRGGGLFHAKMNILMKRFVRARRPFLILMGLILLCGAADAGYLWYANAQVVAAQKESTRKSDQIAAQIKKTAAKKLAAKQKAEADAKAKAAQMPLSEPTPASAAACHSSGPHMDPSRIDAVVNKQHCITPIDFTPADLVTVDGATISAKAEPSFAAMYAAAAAAGAGFRVTSSYRSYADQVATYNDEIAIEGSSAAADAVSAWPGYSEHQLGLAADFSCNGIVLEAFAGSACYKWLVAHAADYGFIQRYPAGLTSITGYSPEPWHWRYVGTTVAKDMKAKGLQTLEEYWGVAGGGY